MDLQQWFDQKQDSIQAQLAIQFNQAVITYFGSVEAAYAERENFIIEARPSTVSMEMVSGNTITLHSNTEFIIRRKTIEELLAG